MYPTSKLKTFFLIFETSQGFEAIFFQYLVFAVHIFIAHNSTGLRAHISLEQLQFFPYGNSYLQYHVNLSFI